MYKIAPLLILVSSFIFCSCKAQQKIMRTVEDAPKLMENKSKFIDKPLSTLLEEVGPRIITVFGEPNGGMTTSTYFLFYFVNRQQYNEMTKRGESPLSIRVEFYPEDHPQRMPVPKGGITDWGPADVKAYGDMKVARIRIVGGNK